MGVVYVVTCIVCWQNAMVMQDRLEKERCDAKNAVEEYVYDMRDKLCGPLEEFSLEQVLTLLELQWWLSGRAFVP